MIQLEKARGATVVVLRGGVNYIYIYSETKKTVE